jgi:trans-AT polyketide synthase, acyltransferase and oxidoreductase domains
MSDAGGSHQLPRIAASALGSKRFRAEYGIKYAYVAGSMFQAIASKEMVVAMARSGLMSYLGTGGLTLDEIETDVRYILSHTTPDMPWGANLLCDLSQPGLEARTVEIFLDHGIRFVEAAAYMQVTPSLVKYRFKGITRGPDGRIETPQRVLAKVSRPEVAIAFMEPAPERILRQLVESGQLTNEEADLAGHLPVASEICVEADSGGHTDQGVAHVLIPAMLALKGDMMARYRYPRPIALGAAGGIGTPEAAAAAFIMGADFILTGSINQCTIEAGTSDLVKDMLQGANVQDMAYAPAGDMFELGAKVQVLRKGIFFPARANRLYELYSRYNSLDEIDKKTRRQLEDRYFMKSLEEIWVETKSYYVRSGRLTSEQFEQPKRKMAAVFKWYFVHSVRLALSGNPQQRIDFQIQCGPAMGAFNQWVKGTPLESWRNRKVAVIGERLMEATADLLSSQISRLTRATDEGELHGAGCGQPAVP